MNENNWRLNLVKGYEVDAMDNDNTWYEAVVDGISNKKIIIRFLGWSKRWNVLFSYDSKKIAPRNSKVPNWRLALSPGKCVEISIDGKTWNSAVCSVIDRENQKFQIICSGGIFKGWFSLNTPLLAEPYTHCGYMVESISSKRHCMLKTRRALFKKELMSINKNNTNSKHAIVGKELLSMVNNQELSDIQFKIENKIIYAHRVILVTRSPYFRSMLLGKMSESNKDIITIPKISCKIFNDIMIFIYSGNVDITCENVFELLESSELFCLTQLKEQVRIYLTASITTQTVIHILIVSNVFSIKPLLEKCITHVINNYDDFEEEDLQLLEKYSEILNHITESAKNALGTGGKSKNSD